MRVLNILFIAVLAALVSVVPALMADEGEPPENHRAVWEQYRELMKAGAEHSSDPELQKQFLEVVTALGYYDLAAEQYEKMLAATPGDPELLQALGEAWMKTGPYGVDKALDAFEKSLQCDGTRVDTLSSLAHLYHKKGLHEQAEKYYAEVLNHEPLHVRARLGKAVLLVRSGDISAASSLLDEVGAQAQPFDVETRTMLRKSLFVFERRGGWIGDTASNHAAYARLLYRAGRITDAVLAARRAVEIEPTDFETWNFIAAMQLQAGSLENAEKAYARSLEAKPDQPEITKQRRQLINELTLHSQGTTR